MLSEKEKAEDFEKRFAEAHRIIEEKQKKLDEADGKLQMLQETVQRLEEKISNVESENKVLRQQAISKSIMHRGSDDGTILGNSSIPALDTNGTPAASRQLTKERSEPDEKQQEHHDMLIRCIAENCGFSDNRPVAACIIFKCLLNWGSFEVENTSVFYRIIQTIGHAIETQADNNDVLAYWLSNSSTLLLLLQRTLIPSVAQSFRGIPQAVDLSYVSGSSGGRSGSISHVEAKHPALLFKQQLTAYVEKIYGIIRDNLKKEICPSLVSIIQAPKKSRASLLEGDRSPTKNIGGQQDLIGHWQDIARSLTNFLNTLKANNVPPFLVRKVFVQIFTFINVQLFNSILLSKELCSLSNGEYVKAGLTELEQWCVGATYEYAGRAYDELKHTRQGIDFFVIHQKSKKTFDEITHDLCPTLSMQQLYRISTSYRDDKNGTHSLARNVIAKLRVLLTDDSYSAGSNQFLLHDDDSSVPFSVDDISQSVKQIDISNLEPPPLIRENTTFLFLFPSNQDKS